MKNNPINPPLTSQYHEPPSNVDYCKNPSVFGKILNGSLPCRTYHESANLLAFQDKYPKSRLHGLVIPKRYIKDVSSLTPSDVELLQEMHELGLSLIQQYEPQAYAHGDYVTCYHVPPFTSVDHLHLHVLAPASEMNFIYRMKYWRGMRWCIDDEVVIDRLESGSSATPYNL